MVLQLHCIFLTVHLNSSAPDFAGREQQKLDEPRHTTKSKVEFEGIFARLCVNRWALDGDSELWRRSTTRRAPSYDGREAGLGTDRRTKSEERRRWAGQCGVLYMSAARH